MHRLITIDLQMNVIFGTLILVDKITFITLHCSLLNYPESAETAVLLFRYQTIEANGERAIL